MPAKTNPKSLSEPITALDFERVKVSDNAGSVMRPASKLIVTAYWNAGRDRGQTHTISVDLIQQ